MAGIGSVFNMIFNTGSRPELSQDVCEKLKSLINFGDIYNVVQSDSFSPLGLRLSCCQRAEILQQEENKDARSPWKT